jgi:arsenate reductase
MLAAQHRYILTKRDVMTIEIFHNPRCSKSRATLALLQERGYEPVIRLYLEDPPDSGELGTLLRKLGFSARELLRKGEPEYRELRLADPSLDDDAVIAAMAEHPRLIERPIVVSGRRAAIGRPPESVLDIL